MHARRFVGRIALITVWTVGIGYAGNLFAAEGGAREKGKKGHARVENKAAGTAVPRELAMRPLPAYRIAPPNVLQIEITNLKAAAKTGCQSSDHPEQGALLGSIGLNPRTVNLTTTGGGTLTLTGPNTFTGGTTVNAGNIDAGRSPSNALTLGFDNANAGTLTLRGAVVTGGTLLTPADAAGLSDGTMMQWRARTASGNTGMFAARPPTTLSARIEKTDSKTARLPPASGQYLVAPDGTVNLRQCGAVQVMGMTIVEARQRWRSSSRNTSTRPRCPST